MSDKDKEGYSMDFLSTKGSKKEVESSKSNKKIETGNNKKQGLNREKISTGEDTSKQGNYNINKSINKELNITKIINSINKHIDSKFENFINEHKKLIFNDNDILKEYLIIRNSIIKLRKSGRVREAMNKLDDLLEVKS